MLVMFYDMIKKRRAIQGYTGLYRAIQGYTLLYDAALHIIKEVDSTEQCALKFLESYY